jgi:hypothetical protein
VVTAPPIVVPVAPTTAEATWSPDFQTLVCDAEHQLVSTGSHWASISQAAAADDLTTIDSESGTISQMTKTAQDDLAVAPAWAPATELLHALDSAAADYRKAANDFKLGVENLDASMLSAGATAEEQGNEQVNRSATDIVDLAATTGFACP